jgi:hypothetical protein
VNYLVLLAQDAQPGLLEMLTRPIVLMIGLPMVFVIGLFAYKITVSIIHHRERMAKMGAWNWSGRRRRQGIALYRRLSCTQYSPTNRNPANLLRVDAGVDSTDSRSLLGLVAVFHALLYCGDEQAATKTELVADRPVVRHRHVRNGIRHL